MSASEGHEQGDTSDDERMSIAAQAVRGLTIIGAEVAMLVLFWGILRDVWNASGGTPSTVSGLEQGAGGALMVAFGAGYAAVLGVEPSTPGGRAAPRVLSGEWWTILRRALKEKWLLLAGVVVYMGIGAATLVTYWQNEAETPEFLQTVSIAFGGYVIAYLGAAFKRFTP